MISKYSVKRPYTVLVAVVLEFPVRTCHHDGYGSKSRTGGK